MNRHRIPHTTQDEDRRAMNVIAWLALALVVEAIAVAVFFAWLILRFSGPQW